MKTLALAFLAEGLLLTVLGLGLRFGFLPEAFIDTVRWDGARLLQLSHPNNCAVMLMLGIGICLALCFRTKRVWCRTIFVVLALAQFGVQIMNHGRTSTVATCLLVGGILFCAIRKTGWKRAPLALAAAVGVMVMTALFLYSKDVASSAQILPLARQLLVTNAAFYIPLLGVNLFRFTIQGLGYSNLAVIAGVFEMIARGAVAALVAVFGFTAVCYASPAAWVLADCFLIPAYFICMNRRTKEAAAVRE